MPLVCKIFQLAEKMEMDLIALKLKDVKQVYLERINKEEVELGFRIRDLAFEKNVIKGIFEDSFLIEIPYRGELRKVPMSRDIPFFFVDYGERVYLVIGDRKLRANRLANTFSELLFAKRGMILESHISHETLKALHESKPSSTKVIYFDNVRIPSVDKLALYGPAVGDTSLYAEYLKFGLIWYAVFETKKGWVIGLTRNCVVTAFSKIEEREFYNFVMDEILPLIEESEKAQEQM
ncbi:MAG: hypothetical protein DRJ51_01115 [Thermoprotei archaeon]|nr:MAG: hypothetical protein DRJ51_01115 [Thermoprotei archaeon]RLE99082.1 MAG: hypothetical protein DRJ59_08275 [Thermoprotei archaeon]